MKGRWAAIGLAPLLVLVALQAWLAFSFVTLSAGEAIPAADLVKAQGRESTGNLLSVVVVTRRTTLFDLVRSWYDPLVEVRPARALLPAGRDWNESRDAMRKMMDQSRNVAAAVALRELGYRIDQAALRGGQSEGMPSAIDFGDAGVLGDSAGLMIALEIYSQLRPDALPRDALIAGTGALEPDGTIRPVDGVAQKIRAGRAAGAQLFLLPRANLEDVGEESPPPRLVPVDTFEQALAALKRLSAED